VYLPFDTRATWLAAEQNINSPLSQIELHLKFKSLPQDHRGQQSV
jgi:hypothetical protein